MGIVTGIIVFILIWWVAIFMVLPWGLERDVDGTPRLPKLKMKVLITTAISFILWVVLYMLIEMEVISFREMARSLVEG